MPINEETKPEFVVKWTVRNFPSLESTTDNDFMSPTFFTEDKTEWQLQLCSDENYVALHLHFLHSHSCHVWAEVQFGILSADERCRYLQSERHHPFSKAAKIFGWKEFINREVLLENKDYLMPENRLSVVCRIVILSRSTRSSKFVEDMSGLLQESEFSDVKLSARGTEFSAHKSILAGRSPVFREIVQTRKENSVIEVDVDAAVFKQLLQFVYTGCDHYLYENFAEIAKDLLIAANKYRIDDLEDVCVNYLCRKVLAGNAVDMAMFAVREKLPKLRMKIVERITSKFVKKDADCIVTELFNLIDTNLSR